MICKVEELQKYSGVYTDETQEQELFLGAAQHIVENYLGYSIEQKNYKKFYSGLGFRNLRLGVKNISAVATVKIDDEEISPENILINDDEIILKNGNFTKGIKNIYVEFVGGFSDDEIPKLMILTVLRIATLLQSESDSNIGITSKTFGDAGTRVFQNYTNFDKYLLPLSKYKILA